MSVPIGAIEVPMISRQDVGVVKTTPQERISERSQVIEVPKTWRLGTAEVVTSVPQEQTSERMGEHSWSVEVPKI